MSMTPDEHTSLEVEVRQIILMERQCTGLTNQLSALKRDGVPGVAVMEITDARDKIKRVVKRWKREVGRTWADLSVVEWANGVHGLGNAVILFLGVVPRMEDFPNPAKLWKYAGLAPGKYKKYSREAKAFAIKRLAEPCIRKTGEPFEQNGALVQPGRSPYRDVYEDRRAHTMGAKKHPPMFVMEYETPDDARIGLGTETDELATPDCEYCQGAIEAGVSECAGVDGGYHWRPGHRNNDARRIAAKAILLDMWLVGNGREPKVGHHRAGDQMNSAPSAPATPELQETT